MQFTGHLQCIHHPRASLFQRRFLQQRQLIVEEADIECSVVDDQFRPLDEIEKLDNDLVESGFVLQELVGQAMHCQRTGLHLALRIDIAMETLSGQLAIEQLDTADLDDAIAKPEIEARGFRIEDDLSHACFPLKVVMP